MAQDTSIFNRKLLFPPITKNWGSLVSDDNFRFDEQDPHHPNLIHGKMFDCLSEKVLTNSSCMFFSKCQEAFEMKTHLDTLNEAIGIPGNVVKTGRVLHIKPKPKVESPVQFGTIVWNATNDEIVLVTEKISTTTFDDWLKAGTVLHEDALILFRDLFYILKKIHIKNMYFGNLRAGIRIYGNKPVLVSPAKFEVLQLDEGIWSDLRELHGMVHDSMPHTTAEWILFNELCEEYAPKVDSVSKLTYKGAQLREGSFLTLSSSIIWNSTERYDVVRKLGEYRSLDTTTYDLLVSDNPSDGDAIPNVDWYTRLKNGAPGSNESSLYAVYQFSVNRGKRSFSTSESIRYFQRCVYEHYKRSNKDYADVSDILYKVYPEAPSELYRMMVRIFYRQTRMPNPMPSIIDFCWKEPHSFSPKKIFT